VPLLASQRCVTLASAVEELADGSLLVYVSGAPDAAGVAAARPRAALAAARAAGAVVGHVAFGGWLIRTACAPDGRRGLTLAYAVDMDLGGSPSSFVCAAVARAQATAPLRLAALLRRRSALRPALASSMPPLGRQHLREVLERLVAGLPHVVRVGRDGGVLAEHAADEAAGGRARALSWLVPGGADGGAAAGGATGGAGAGGGRADAAADGGAGGTSRLARALGRLLALGACGVFWHAGLLAALPGWGGMGESVGALSSTSLALACLPLACAQLFAAYALVAATAAAG
jgi:hypothetical protein